MSLVKNFVFVTKAGQGKYGTVGFYLPVDGVDEFSKQNHDPSPSSPGFDKLTRSLVAVKVASKPEYDTYIDEEVATLQTIERSTNSNPDICFSKPIHTEISQLERDPDQRAFLVLEAITPPVTLHHMLWTDVSMPIPLVYHLFLSLGSAMRFLRDEVGWKHQDIKEDNVLVRQGPSELHQFVLVDFGNAVAIEDSRHENEDCKKMLVTVNKLAKQVAEQWGEWEQHQQGWGESETVGKMADRGEQHQEQDDWAGFQEMLDSETKSSRPFGQVDEAFEDIWNRWKGVAQKARDERTKGETDRIKEIFEKADARAADEGRKVRDEDLIGAVKRYRKGEEAQRQHGGL